MGIERWTDSEHSEARSINEQRRQAERELLKQYEEEQREYQKQLKRDEYARRAEEQSYDIHNPIAPATNMMKSGLMRTAMDDPVMREAQAAKQVFSSASDIILGTALIIASCATEVIHNNALAAAEERSIKDFKSEIPTISTDYKERDTLKLSEYKNDIAETRKEVIATHRDEFRDYQYAKNNAEEIKTQATHDYQTKMDSLKRQETKIDEAFKSEREQIESRKQSHESEYKSRIESSETARDRSISAAQDVYKREESRIRSEYSGNEMKTELAKAAKTRDDNIERAQSLHKSNTDSYKVSYDNAIKAENKALSDAETRKNTKMNDITNARSAALDIKNTVHKEQNEIIKTSKDQYEARVASKKKEYDNAQIQLMKFQTNNMKNDYGEVGKKLSGRYNLDANHSHVSSKTAGKYAEVLTNNHKKIGLDIAAMTGTADEKAILARIKNGTASSRDKEKQKDIIQKYAGNISSAKGVDDAITKLGRSIKRLDSEIKNNNAAIKLKTDSVKDLNEKIGLTQKKIDQFRADRDALKSGRNTKGIALTADEKKAIKARMDKADNIEDMKKNLSDLIKKRNEDNNTLKTAKQRNQDAENMKNAIGRQIHNLKRGGKSIADTKTKKPITLAQATKAAVSPAFAFSLLKQQHLNKTGESKKANKMGEQGAKKIVRSITKIQNKALKDMHQGNLVHRELKQTAGTMAKTANMIDMSTNIARKALGMVGMTVGSVIKHNGRVVLRIGGKTRLGQALGKGFKTVANSRVGKILKGGGIIVGVGSTTLLGNALKAPGSLLRMPSKLLNAPQAVGNALLKTSFRTTRRTVGAIGGGTVRLARKTTAVVGRGIGAVSKKAFKATIGKTKWWQRSGSKMAAGLGRIGGRIKKFGQTIIDLNPVKVLRRAAGAILGVLSAIIGWLVSTIWTLICWFIGLVFFLIIIVAVVVVVLGLLYSVLDTIKKFLLSTTSEYKSLVKNEPNYIMNQAVNYRNAELDIFELFRAAKANPSLIKVNDSPIYYALYADSFYDPGKQRTNQFYKYNDASYNKLNELYDAAGLSRVSRNKFKSNITTYSNVDLWYYTADQLKTTSTGAYAKRNGQYVLKSGAVPSEYEVSNARDALAMVDSLYVDSNEEMQKIEVLAYLGVGEYQVGVNDGNSKNYSADDDAAQNLFWLSHNFIYNSGNSSDDIYFHRTVAGQDSSYVDGEKLVRVHNYVVDNRNTSNAVIGDCKNHVATDNAKIVKRYTKTERNVPAHETLGEYDNYEDKDPYGEYKVTDATLPNKMAQSLTPTQLYYYQLYGSRNSAFGGLTTSGDFEYREIPIGGGETRKVWTAAINKIDSSKLTKLHKNADNCKKLNFYRKSVNTYYVTDNNNNYMGTYNIGNDSKFYNAITEIETNSGKKQVNKLSGSSTISLQYFFVKWDSEKDCYVFRIMCKGKPRQMSEPGGFEELLATAKTQIGVVYSQGRYSDTTNPKNGVSRSHPCVSSCIYYNTGTKHWTCKKSNGRNYYSDGNSYGTHGLDCSSYCSYIFAYTFPDEYGYFWSGGPYTTFLFDSDASRKGYKLSLSSHSPQEGDILWRQGHVAFYIGNNKYLHASNYGVGIGYGNYNPSTHSGFTHVLRYPINGGGSAEFKPNSNYTWSESLKNTYSSIETYNPKFDSTKVTINCRHKITKTVTHEINYDYCKGHIDLDVALAVSLAEDRLLDDAKNVTGMLQEKEAGAFLGILHDKNQDLWGIGDVTYKVFDPKRDWRENSNARQMTDAKLLTDIDYMLNPNDNISKIQMKIKHYMDTSPFMSVSASNENQLLFNMRFNGNTYQVPYFVSGKQVDIIVYPNGNKNAQKYLMFYMAGQNATTGLSGRPSTKTYYNPLFQE